MEHFFQKSSRFFWRVGRNLICTNSWGKNWLFPPQKLANSFGPSDTEYAIRIFLHHIQKLENTGFNHAFRIWEIGPGRNLGTSLLMWSLNQSRTSKNVSIILWDVFPNMVVSPDTLRECAKELLIHKDFHEVVKSDSEKKIEAILVSVVNGERLPDIQYRVQSLTKIAAFSAKEQADLIYSHAALEHIWKIREFWEWSIRITCSGGWHSHRIDLADHGRRETNYIEMLEWSEPAYWLTMRFVPGAINRWRASKHLDCIKLNGLQVLSSMRGSRKSLPIPKAQINRSFRQMDELDLLTTALELVAVKL